MSEIDRFLRAGENRDLSNADPTECCAKRIAFHNRTHTGKSLPGCSNWKPRVENLDDRLCSSASPRMRSTSATTTNRGAVACADSTLPGLPDFAMPPLFANTEHQDSAQAKPTGRPSFPKYRVV